jgi:hypothetical protein
MNINFKIRNVEKVKKYLTTLPRGVMRVALAAMSEWFIGDSQGGLKHPEPYKFASRKRAYGKVSGDGAPDGYFSWKQFRYVAWKTKGFTDLGDKRTGQSLDAWTYKPTETNKGYQFRLVNPTPGAYFTQDDYGQARQPKNVGWKKVTTIINKNMAGAIKAAKFAVNSFLKSK